MVSLLDNFKMAFHLLLSFDTDLYSIMFLSLYVSGTATIIATVFALPFGVYLAVQNFRGKNTIISILNGLTGLPPVVLGLSVYLLLSRSGPLGEWGILYSPLAMILTQSILVFPIIATTMRVVAENQYTTVKPYYAMLGVAKYRLVFSMLYDLRFVIFTAIMAGLGRALSEVGAMLIVGGNIESYTRIMTTAISLETGKGNLGFALAIGIILLTIIMIINWITTYVNIYARNRYDG